MNYTTRNFTNTTIYNSGITNETNNSGLSTRDICLIVFLGLIALIFISLFIIMFYNWVGIKCSSGEKKEKYKKNLEEIKKEFCFSCMIV